MIPDDIHASCASEMARLTKERDEARAELRDALRLAEVLRSLVRDARHGDTDTHDGRADVEENRCDAPEFCWLCNANKALAGELAGEVGT